MVTPNELVDEFCKKKVLVVGDVMLDKYIWGKVKRISPEASVPVVEETKIDYNPGGAANLAANMAALGCNVTLIGVIGKGDNSTYLMEALKTKERLKPIMLPDDRPTTTKTRLLDLKGHHLMRHDHESKAKINAQLEKEISEILHNTPAAAIVISDYAKGVITQEVFNAAKSAAKKQGIPLFVDPKPRDSINYAGSTIIKFNLSEARAISGLNGDYSFKEIAEKLKGIVDSNFVITAGDEGAGFFNKKQDWETIPTKAREVSDVCGAGDTFLAALALAYTCEPDIELAVHMGNCAAGIKVGKVGAVSISSDELKRELCR